MKYRLKDIFNKHIFKYVSYILILVAVVVIIISLLPVKSVTISSSAEIVIRNTNSEVIETASEPSSTIAVKTFAKNGYPNINHLIVGYYNALMTNDDGKISKYTDSVQNIDPYKRLINAQYIESYENIDCYTMPGLIDNTYIVVVSYQLKYKNFTTLTPYLDYFYICTDSSSNIYISNKSLSGEVEAYNDLMYENNVIKELSQYVSAEYEITLKNDIQLAEFINSIQQ